MPDTSEVGPSPKGKKDKSWRLWERWSLNRYGVGGWRCFGRYRTHQEAERVMFKRQRKYAPRGDVERPRNPGSFSVHLTWPRKWHPEEFKVLHESEGKPG